MDHRIVIIGPGGISKLYVDVLSRLKNASVVGIVGRDEEKTKRYAEENGIPFHGIGLEKVANSANASAVIICTPNSLHCDFVKQASALGLHCLCEKPLDISPPQQDEMIEVCRKHKVKLAVSYMHRFKQHVIYMKNLINNGSLGKLLVVDVKFKAYRTPEYYASSWHGTKDIDGGGPFIQQGSHLIDLAINFAGNHKRVLAAKRFNVFHDIEVEDHGYAIVEYENDSIGMIEMSTACEGFAENVIEISGTKGHAIIDFEKIINLRGEGLCEKDMKQDSNIVGCFERLVCDFLDAIEKDREPFVNGESAKLATNLICDIYDKSGLPIMLRK